MAKKKKKKRKTENKKRRQEAEEMEAGSFRNGGFLTPYLHGLSSEKTSLISIMSYN
jgi:hypothetical protein